MRKSSLKVLCEGIQFCNRRDDFLLQTKKVYHDVSTYGESRNSFFLAFLVHDSCPDDQRPVCDVEMHGC